MNNPLGLTQRQKELLRAAEWSEQVADKAKTLDLVNYQMAELKVIKEKLEASIQELLGHSIEGSKTYEVGQYSITVKTDMIYSVDKAEYSIYRNTIDPSLNPVRERIAFDIDKKKMRELEQYLSDDDLKIYSHFITKKPSKLNVKVKANV